MCCLFGQLFCVFISPLLHRRGLEVSHRGRHPWLPPLILDFLILDLVPHCLGVIQRIRIIHVRLGLFAFPLVLWDRLVARKFAQVSLDLEVLRRCGSCALRVLVLRLFQPDFLP